MNLETNKLRNEEIQKTTIEERFEKALHDLHQIKNEHMTVNSVEISIDFVVLLKIFQFKSITHTKTKII